MTSRRGGAIAVAIGVVIAAWAWFGAWPWSGPAVYSGSDYSAINGIGVGVVVLGCFTALVGVFLLFAGRGGPRSWDGL